MNSYFRNGTVVLALLAGVSIAAAQTTPTRPGSSPAPGATMSQGSALHLTAAQKSTIFQAVTKEKVKSPPPANLRLSVGTQVPASVELYPLPANLATQIPAAMSYKYTVAQNQVVLVDPTSMKIVDIIRK